MPYVLGFDRCNHEILDRVGGKCASLGSLVRAGANVFPGFAVTTNAWQTMLATSDLQNRIYAELGRISASNDPALDQVGRTIRAMIEEAPLDSTVETAIREALGDLAASQGTHDVPVAVRSSATAEDLPNASFAGLHDTSLWVVGAERVLREVRRCWSSLFTPRAIAYRIDNGFSHVRVSMAVGIQKMVRAKSAGVAFSLNPANGDRSKIAIDSSFGFGEAVVGGQVTPDHFLVDKVIFEVAKQVISPKHIEYALDSTLDKVVLRDVETTRQLQPSLSRSEILAIARMAKWVEKQFGSPQDIEWAIDADTPAVNTVVILQSRPETVWSRRVMRQVATNHSHGITGMVHTLIQGVKVEPSNS